MLKKDTSSPLPPLEFHPWPPFIPQNAKILIMGTFPPKAHRWSMDFYYPNPINDFWRIMGLIFHNDKDTFWRPETSDFDLPAIKSFLLEKGIALNDTARAVRRLRDNASDKFLQIVEPVPLLSLLHQMPLCTAIATTGQKAAEVIASLTQTPVPQLGQKVHSDNGGRTLDIWRMPSSSRAFPMPLHQKAHFYKTMFEHSDII